MRAGWAKSDGETVRQVLEGLAPVLGVFTAVQVGKLFAWSVAALVVPLGHAVIRRMIGLPA